MNTPNPLIPQGTFPDSRSRSHVRLAVFTILAVHVVLLSALLMAGCKRTAESETESKMVSNTYSNVTLPTDTNPPPPVQSSATPVVVSPPPVTTAATVSPTPDTTANLAGTEYVVLKGDSFTTIAKKYALTVKAIQDANPGVDSTKLKIGQKVKVPAASVATAATTHSPSDASNGVDKTYTVKSGDNLLKIAKASGVSVSAIRSANTLKTDQIKVGQKLKIPGRTSASEPAGAAPGTAAVTANPTQ